MSNQGANHLSALPKTNSKERKMEVAETLLTTYYRNPNQKKICNCTMCPQLGRSQFAGRHFDYGDYCDVVEGRVLHPEWCWCKTGIALMWMKTHSAKDCVDLLAGLNKP